MIDRFYCPQQTTESFSFDTCRNCKWLEITRTFDRFSVKCRQNKNHMMEISFESAYLLDQLGIEYHVEIVKKE